MLAKRLGVEHRTLTWTGEKPTTGIEEAARAARYALLDEAAKKIGATHLATAHTREDQAETLLMRLAAGSGPAGLAGMRARVKRDGVVMDAATEVEVGSGSSFVLSVGASRFLRVEGLEDR